MTFSPALDAPSVGTAAGVLGRLSAAIAAVREVPRSADAYRTLSDDALLELQRLGGAERQLVDAHNAVIAGEIARRSAPTLGHQGLAQRQGFRTPEELVRVSTRSTARDASTAVRVGRLALDAQPDPLTGEPTGAVKPWLIPVMDAVAAGTLPPSSADAISTGLGQPSATVTVDALRAAAEHLCVQAATLDADRLGVRARRLRDEIDPAGVVERERELRDRRSLRHWDRPDGSGRVMWDMDPETNAAFKALHNAVTSPRRGGPRFVDEVLKAQAAAIAADERTTEQLASDVFLQLLMQGADADSSQLLGTGAPSVRVLVTATDLEAGTGVATIDGETAAVSIATVERMICSGSTLPIILDTDGKPLDVGREQRLFTRKQRIALAARDGGCMLLDCSRPASWTEAHHLTPWSEGGGTDIADGILLCRHHHLLLHDEGWVIERRGTAYWLTPPPTVDPEQKAIELRSKSPTYVRHVAQAAAEMGGVR